MTTWLLVATGAAVGAPMRWLVDQRVAAITFGAFPWGTMTVNVTGSFLLGIILGIDAFADGWPRLVAIAGTGFCGAFTTFSTFAVETVRLGASGSYLMATANAVGSLVLGLAAACAGWYLVDLIV